MSTQKNQSGAFSATACKGYLRAAAKNLDYNKEQLYALSVAVDQAMEQYTVEEAEELYQDEPY